MKISTITNTVPCPQHLRIVWTHHFPKLQVDESFAVYPEGDEDLSLIANRIGATKRKYEKKLGTKYVTKRTDRGRPGIRVWRVE